MEMIILYCDFISANGVFFSCFPFFLLFLGRGGLCPFFFSFFFLAGGAFIGFFLFFLPPFHVILVVGAGGERVCVQVHWQHAAEVEYV